MATEAGRGLSGPPLADRTLPDIHFPNRQGFGFSSNDRAHGQSEPGQSGRCHFSIFRADSVSVTSTRFVGGDWRWRLSGPDGAMLVEGGGYRNEARCRQAVAILKARAPNAIIA